jgi:GNAT superfamily N-acetyltransferase
MDSKEYRRRQFEASSVYGWIRSRELEGTMHLGLQAGVFVQTSMRVTKGWGVVPENRCPHPGRNAQWPIDVPKELDEIAKHNCFPMYARLTSLEETMMCLEAQIPLLASFYINHASWLNAITGRITISSNPNDAVHAVLLIGYSIPDRVLYFQNSWGSKWGKNGLGTMSFEYFEKNLQEIYISVCELNSPLAQKNPTAFGLDLPIGHYECLDLWDLKKGNRSAWIIARVDEDQIEIDDLFVRPEYRRQGLATKLILPLTDMAKVLNVPILSWISLANTETKTATLAAINALCQRFGFKQSTATVPWAKFLVTRDGSGPSSSILKPGDTLPPGCSLEAISTFLNYEEE